MNFTLELLAAGIIVSAVLHINAEYHGPQWKNYIFKPLTMVLIITMGLNLLPEDIGWYHLALLVGLLFPIGGDVALMWPSDKFLLGLVSFLTGHVFYISGLHSGIEWTSTGVVWAPLLIFGSGMFWVLRSGLGKMQVPVLVYILVILIMSGLAWERHLQLELPQTLFAACGAILFLNFRRNVGLESISDEIQIRTVFYPEHLLCRTVGNSNLNEPGHVQSVVLKMGVIKKLLNNYRFLLQDLREGHTLLFVMHVFFVGGAVLTLLLVLLFSGFRLLF